MGGGAINIFSFQGRLLETIDYDDPVGAEPQQLHPPLEYACRVSTDSNSGNCTHISLVILNAQNRQTTIWILKMARIGL